MVNGKSLDEEIKSIEIFFEKMSIEEFETMMLECGANNISESNESNYVIACKSLPTAEQVYVNYININYGNEFVKDFVHKHNGQDNFVGAA